MSAVPQSDPAEPRPDPIEAGIQAGLERAARNDVDVSRETLEDSFFDLRAAVESQEEHLHPRFVELYAENVAVAIAARQQYQHEALSRDEIVEFLDFLGRLQNSWKHLIL